MPKRPAIFLLLYKRTVRKYLLILQFVFVVIAQAQSFDPNLSQLYEAAQQRKIDSLQSRLAQENNDTAKVDLLNAMDSLYFYLQQDDALLHSAQQALRLAKKSNYLKGEIYARLSIINLSNRIGDYKNALQLALQNLRQAEQAKDTMLLYWANRGVSGTYSAMRDDKTVLVYTSRNKRLVHSGYFKQDRDIKYYSLIGYIIKNGAAFDGLNQLDSALYYERLAYTISQYLNENEVLALSTGNLAATYLKLGNYDSSFYYYKISIPYAVNTGFRFDLAADAYLGMAKIFDKKGQPDSALYYAKRSLRLFKRLRRPSHELSAAEFLNQLYAGSGHLDSAYKYLALANILKDSLFNENKTRQVQMLGFTEVQRQNQIEQARKETQQRYENEIKIYILIGGLILLLILAFFLYRNNQQKRKAYTLLQKQNAQAQLEAALERVRAQAMAMRNSNDVSNAIGLLFTELDKLGIVTIRCGIIIIEEVTETMEVWTAIPTAEGRVGQISGKVDANIHPLLKNGFEAWRQKERFYSYDLVGNDVLNYYKAITTNAPQYSLPVTNSNTERQICSVFFFKEGALFTFTDHSLAAETRLALEKFAAVFSLTYRRYLDLKMAEEQTQLVVKQASLDRVRAEIASMRSTDDLQRITPLIWRELHTLHVPFVRCGVFIVDETDEITHAYLSTPKGQVLGILNVHIEEDAFTRTIVEHWRKGMVYTEHWNKEQFISWMQTMIDLKQIQNKEMYQGEAHPPESLYLHFVPFTQGMLYVGNTAPLSANEIQLVKSLAEAFAIAYARYEDFKQLEDAKNKVETTLHELKTTQRQLLQKEKMASLGELTAGVAHEIQNPLNFVNNFSEVSAELLTEMKEALKRDDKQEAIAVADSLIDNLQKIAYHGKRADAIVKGMLQHSRKSTGEKEPTDINVLADEYLRLSYQGIRAKDKNFNAILETHFDESIGKINIVPQDISRVLLNLFNNAFYAVNEKKRLLNGDFQPAVTICTKKTNNTVILTVKDNGNGIPQQVMDKIFQPFFTTKPTGQGTGLGLSISYDIIKAHGGELKVESKEGEGTHFIIQLPV